MKRLISMLLAIVMLVSMVPILTVPASAAEDWRGWTQGDSRWGSIKMGKSSETMAGVGCLVTSVSKIMVQSGYVSPSSFNPGVLVNWLNANNGFYENTANLIWAKPAAMIDGFELITHWQGIEGSSSSCEASIVNLVREGKHVILGVGEHYVAVDNTKTQETGKVYIWDTKTGTQNVDVLLTSRYSYIYQVAVYSGWNPASLCDHKYGAGGKCTKTGCGYVYPITVNTAEAGTYKVVTEFTPRTDAPYDAATKDTVKISAGKEIEVLGSVQNGYGNKWYKISYGGKIGYVYHDYLQAITYTVSYNANGGSGAPGSQTKYHGTALTLSSTKPTRSGYTFMGWSTSSTATSATYSAGGKYTTNANVTLYAVWEKHVCDKGTYKYRWAAHPHYNCYACSKCGEINAAYDEENYSSTCETCNPSASTYTITYNSNGGTCNKSTMTVSPGQQIGTMPGANRSGYIFAGWYTSASGGTRIYEDHVFTGNTTVYAHWRSDYVNLGDDFYAYMGHLASGHGIVANGGNVELGGRYSNTALWRFVRQQNGSYMIENVSTGKVLDVYDASVANWSNVQVYTSNSTLAQRWYIRQSGSGYVLHSALSDKALDVYYGSSESVVGDNVQIYTANDSAAQIMYIDSPTLESSSDVYRLGLNRESIIEVQVRSTYNTDWTSTVEFSNDIISAVSCDWRNDTMQFTLLATGVGSTVMTIKLYDALTGNLVYTKAISFEVPAGYTYTFDFNNGTGATESVTANAGESIIVPSTIPYYLGHTFLGWGLSRNSSVVSFVPKNELEGVFDRTFYAVYEDAEELPATTTFVDAWITPKYTHAPYWLKYVPSVSTSYEIKSIDNSVDPYVAIYDAAGNVLATDDDGGDGAEFKTACYMNAGETYYIAVSEWNTTVSDCLVFLDRGYAITYNANGGSNAPASTYVYSGDGGRLTSAVPTRSGYTFLGWAEKANATAAKYSAGQYVNIDANITLYAMWSKNCDAGHSWNAATCTVAKTCKTCGATEGSALGHSWNAATCTAAKTCKTCGVTEGGTIPHTFDQEKVEPKYLVSEGTYYKSCKCGAVGTETFTVAEPDAFGFKDVPKNAYYHDAVMWAVENGITTGTGDGTTFEPNAICTRGQVVTFLWRAAGKPEPAGNANPFTDVKSTDYFYKAVLWAVENSITTGTGDGSTFEPNANCNRAQIVTFLSRAKNGQPTTSNNPFKDVPAGAYYYNPVLWAVENKITTGTGDGTTFEPNSDCTRGQVITFLWRAYTK